MNFTRTNVLYETKENNKYSEPTKTSNLTTTPIVGVKLPRMSGIISIPLATSVNERQEEITFSSILENNIDDFYVKKVLDRKNTISDK